MDEPQSWLDLRPDSNQSSTPTSATCPSKILPSPRIHVAGEAPPELSPLDAFAMQSRLLAKQLQESTKKGHRLSRLPPLTVESPLIQQGRSDYFRSLSHESPSESAESPDLTTSGLGLKADAEAAFTFVERPRSLYPRIGRISPSPEDAASVPILSCSPILPSIERKPSARRPEPNGSFGARRERSPSPIQSHSQPPTSPERNQDQSPPPRNAIPLPLSAPRHLLPASGRSPEKAKAATASSSQPGLLPPRIPYSNRSPSAASSPVAAGEEEVSVHSMTSPLHPLSTRNLSSTGPGFANTATSPVIASLLRSPSSASDSSGLPLPSLNFSRPLSRAGTPGLEIPTRQPSSDSQPSFILADESAHTPVSVHSEAFMEQPPDDGRSPAPSYVYSTFSLPRGKSIQRSDPSPERPSLEAVSWERPSTSPTSPHPPLSGAPPSPPTRPSSSSAKTKADDAVSMISSIARPSLDAAKSSFESSRMGLSRSGTRSPNPNPSRPSLDPGRQSEDAPRGRSLTSPPHEQAASRGKTPASTTTSDSASTTRPSTMSRLYASAPSASEMTAEEHLAKGIQCHESGSLNESTYHLRHAAKQNNPTAMLLYALACRHGWGMRANQREGVQWLRRAAEHASIEIADDQDRAKEGKPASFLESKTRKAQFALSIYELGVSHMNGWGIEQDKSLALRCFEIAGSKLLPSS